MTEDSTVIGDDGDVTSDGGAGDGSVGTDSGTTVDTTPPSVVSVIPAAAANGVWLHDRFIVTFTEPVAPATVTTQSLRLLDPASQNMSGEVIVSGAIAIVRAVDSAAMVGQLRLEVGTAITDVAGNGLPATASFAWALPAWTKPAAALAVGAGPGVPAVATGTDDAVWAATATTVGIVIVDANGTQVGATLGAAGATTPALAGGIVAWAQAGAIQAAQWNGAAWTALPSPGAGSLPALAVSPAGAVGIAFVDGANDVVTARLASGTWQAAAPIAATLVPVEPSVAMPNDTTVVVGFVDRAATVRVRVATVAAGIVEQGPLTLLAAPPAGTQNRVSVAARGSTVAVAWDESSGFSFSAHVAIAAGTGWTILPTLDVDPSADSRAPVVQLDGTGAPLAAWTERIEGAHRGFVARWTGAAWQTIGGDAWTGAPSTAPVRASFVLWRGVVPVVAWLAAGGTGIELSRFNGPGTPRLGIAARAPLTGCAFDAASPPATLTATGCFTIAGGAATPHAGLVPYDLISELWSDGALKRRWIGLPTGTLSTLANSSLDAPTGSFVIKEFAINDPAARAIMETRFLARTASGWSGFSYRWRADGSDADLLAGNNSITVSWPLAGGGTHAHIYPSRAQCQRCHNASVGPLLGVRADQLARRFDYGGVLDDQLRVFGAIGIFSAGATTPYPAPHDPRVSFERRVRGYLAANCAHCHNPAGERPAQDFRITTPLANTGLCALITPGDPAGSTLYQRDTRRPGMPPIATDIVDPLVEAIELGWISSITTCP